MNRFRGWLLVPLLTAGVVVSVTMPVSVGAQDSSSRSGDLPAFTIEPVGQDGTYFMATLEAGGAQELTAALGNAVDAPAQPTRTFAADAFTLTNGGFGVREEGDPATGATTWLDYAAETLDLAAGESVERIFTVSVPSGTPAGQYITGLVLQTAEPIAVGGTPMLRQIIRKAVAVLITVPGPITPELAIGAVALNETATGVTLQIEIGNPGNVLLKPSGTVTLMTQAGETVMNTPVVMGSVYAGMTTGIEMSIPTTLEPGDYVVAVDLADAATGATAVEAALPLSVAGATTADSIAEPVGIKTMTVEPTREERHDRLQFVTIAVGLANAGEAIPSARLTMHVTLDGALLEDFPLNSSLVVPTGGTEIVQRYVPLETWTPGLYGFSATLEAVDAVSGQVTLLAHVEESTSMTVTASDLSCGCPSAPTDETTHVESS